MQRVTLSCVTPTWEPVAGSERSLEADTLVVGYGLLASSELARQAGCAMQWKPAEGGWTVVHDEQMRTSQSRISWPANPPASAAPNWPRSKAASPPCRPRWTCAAQAPLPDLALAPGTARQATRAAFQPRRAAVLRTSPGRAGPIGDAGYDPLPLRGSHGRRHTRIPGRQSARLRRQQRQAGLPQRNGVLPGALLPAWRGAAAGADARQDVAELGAFTARAPVKPVTVAALRQLDPSTDETP